MISSRTTKKTLLINNLKRVASGQKKYRLLSVSQTGEEIGSATSVITDKLVDLMSIRGGRTRNVSVAF